MASVHAGSIAAKKWDGDGVPLAESNCAGIGTDEDKAARKAAAATEPAWAGMGEAPGLDIWRIEDFKVVPWPKEKYGQFFKGDSYLMLHTELDEEKLVHNIYFWLGESTSTDEMGTAAYKTVELDDLLDGNASQHREVQGSESDEFQSLFKTRVTYLEGGVDSGFNHAQPEIYGCKLLRMKRKATGMTVKQVPAVCSSLNQGDCFVLDAGVDIFTWFGEAASPFEKQKCNEYAKHLEAERTGHAKCAMADDAGDAFWSKIGGEQSEILSAEAGEEPLPDHSGEAILYHLETETGEDMAIHRAMTGGPGSITLDASKVNMLDVGPEVFVWVGTGAAGPAKANAMRAGSAMLAAYGKPKSTPVHVVKQSQNITNKLWKKFAPTVA